MENEVHPKSWTQNFLDAVQYSVRDHYLMNFVKVLSLTNHNFRLNSYHISREMNFFVTEIEKVVLSLSIEAPNDDFNPTINL